MPDQAGGAMQMAEGAQGAAGTMSDNIRRTSSSSWRGSRRLRVIAQRVVGLGSARAIGVGANGLALILVARQMGPSDFGQFTIAWSLAWVISGALALGLPTFALRAATLGDVDAAGFALFLNLVTSVVIAVAAFVGGLLVSDVGVGVMVLLAVSVAVEKNAEARVGLGMEFGASRAVNLVIAFRGTAVLGIVVLAGVIGLPADIAFGLGRLGAVSIGALILARVVRAFPMRTRCPRDGSMASLGGLAASSSFGALKQLDVVLVGAAAGSYSAGAFGAVLRIAQPFTMLASSVCLVAMGPAVRGGDRVARRALKVLLAGAFGMLAVLGVAAIWSSDIVELVLGSEFSDAAIPFGLMLLSIPALTMSPMLLTILVANGAAKQSAVIVGVTMALYLAAIPVGAVSFGAAGAAGVMGAAMWARLAWLACAVHGVSRVEPGPSRRMAD